MIQRVIRTVGKLGLIEHGMKRELRGGEALKEKNLTSHFDLYSKSVWLMVDPLEPTALNPEGLHQRRSIATRPALINTKSPLPFSSNILRVPINFF